MTQEPLRTELELQSLTHLAAGRHNLPTSLLYEEIARRSEGPLTHRGPVIVPTGHPTGRAPNDPFVVGKPSGEAVVGWGPFDQPLSSERIEALRRRMLANLQGKDLASAELFRENLRQLESKVSSAIAGAGLSSARGGTSR